MSEESKHTEQDRNNVFELIMRNYQYMNHMMINQMEIMSDHPGLTGHYREKMWLDFFRSIVPRKYSFAQGVILIDSFGRQSKEVDIAVFDEQFTPYVFHYHSLKFIPIEAVAVVISCKSKELSMNNLVEWSKSIDALHTCRAGITRVIQGLSVGYTNASQTRTRPIKILAAMKEYDNEQPAIRFQEKLQDCYDIIIIEKGKQTAERRPKRFELYVPCEEQPLGWWFRQLNQVKDKGVAKTHTAEYDCSPPANDWDQAAEAVEADGLLKVIPGGAPQDGKIGLTIANTLKQLRIDENPLLTLNLQLNQLLMLINNPMLFPHYAYANRFNKILAGGTDDNA